MQTSQNQTGVAVLRLDTVHFKSKAAKRNEQVVV
jgi:hypothetical protein